MALFNLYSRRKRNANKEGADVYQYTVLSSKLRRQIIFVFEDAFEILSGHHWQTDEFWTDVVAIMRRELGVSALHAGYFGTRYEELVAWFMKEDEIDHLIDAMETMVIFASFHFKNRDYGREFDKLQARIDELNARLREGEFGFQIDGGRAIQVSSQFIHSEVIIPALSLLANPKLTTADEEFRKAHAEFRAGSYEDCLTDCCKAFESVLKVISAEKGWGTPDNATAKVLVQAMYDNKLVPDYMQNEFTGLRSILEGGVPTVRNKAGGHGQGVTARTVSANLASFQLHQTAAAILFLVNEAGLKGAISH